MHYFAVEINDPILADILVIDVPSGASLGSILNIIYQEDPSSLIIPSAIFIRPNPGRQIHPSWINHSNRDGTFNDSHSTLSFLNSNPSDIDLTFDRVPSMPVHILHSYEFSHYLSDNINLLASPFCASRILRQGTERILSQIQNAELDYLVAQGHAEFPHIEDMPYITPAGAKVDQFLRVGNVQYSRASLDGLFFWLIPFLSSCDAIVTDTWSIGSTALHISRRLATYRNDERRPCPVELLGEYFIKTKNQIADVQIIISRLDELLRLRQASRPSHWPTQSIIFLFSAINTGKLLKSVREQISDMKLTRRPIVYICLYKLGDSDEEIIYLRDYSESGKFNYTEQGELLIDSKQDTVPVDDRTYFPMHINDVEHIIFREFIQPFRENFLNTFGDLDIVTVHQTDNTNGSAHHHAIRIDTDVLVSHPEFIKRLMYKVKNLNPAPNVIITPGHQAGIEMANIALDELKLRSVDAKIFIHPNLYFNKDISEKEENLRKYLEKLNNSDTILLIDDTFTTGARLAGYEKQLRKLEFKGYVHYLVGVSRPTSIAYWNRRTMHFVKARRDDASVHCIVQIILPNWSKNYCPWCQELSALLRFGDVENELLQQDAIFTRINDLSKEGNVGRGDNLFLKPSDTDRLSFTIDSFFAPLGSSEAWMYGAVASTIQFLRNSENSKILRRPTLGIETYPVSTVIKYNDYLVDCWSDSIIRASIIRAAQPLELEYANSSIEAERLEAARTLIGSDIDDDSDLRCELWIGELTGRFKNLKACRDEEE